LAIGGSSYRSMFRLCTSLTSAPNLPATTLANYCYHGMFYGCTSLTSAPALPATTVFAQCYSQMFFGCISLKSLPALPATTLPDNCYSNMFNGCSNIKVSTTQGNGYNTTYIVPSAGSATINGGNQLTGMFSNTGGTFVGTPNLNQTYYLKTI
jgi:hypothetical protein